MPSAGTHLKELREARGLSLEEISRITRVRRPYLEALEADSFRDLPPPAFVRGFLRAYCQALNEPAEETLRLYLEQVGEPTGDANRGTGRGGGRSSRDDRDLPARGREPVLVSLVLLVVLGVALFALTFALQRGSRHNEPPAAGPERGAAPVGEAPVTDGAPAAVQRAPADAVSGGVPAAARPRPLVRSRPAESDPATTVNRLVAKVREKTWMRVQTEEGGVSEELMNPGDTREWMSNQRFVVTIGNAGGITLELNGRELPPLGPSGQLVRQLVLPSDPR